MSARLYIEGIEADTLGDIDVEFTFSVADISDIERRNTSFSKTLTLPSTAKNQQLFGNIFDISVSNDIFEGPNIGQNFNPARQAKTQIFLDNVKIYDGVMRMMKINNVEGNIVYEVNMFGRLRDILHELGDRTLADLDFSGETEGVISYDHTWNQANIEASWARTEWVEGAQNYVYPLVDYGRSLDMEVFPIENFKPAVFVSEILKRIFDEAGFQIQEPNFFTSSFYFKKLILLTAEKTITKETTTLLEQSSILYTVSTGNDPSFSHILEFASVQDDGFTINAEGDTFTWNKTQPLNTGLTFNAKVSFIATQAFIWNVWNMRVLRNGVEVLQSSVNVQLNSIGDIFNWDLEIVGGVTLANGDDYQIELTGEVVGGGGGGMNLETDVVIQQNGILKIGNTVPTAVDLEEGDEMKIEYTMPKSMKQRDFLKSIISMYNLYVTQDRLQTNVLEIIPYNEFFQTFKNEALDWTDKLDYSQEISITPLSELSAKEYRFTFDDDTDFWSASYKAKFNQAYGESRTIVPNDFELDTKTVKVVFGSPVMREEVPGQIMVHLYKSENSVKVPDNFKPRIVFFAPNQPTLSPWQIDFEAGPVTYNTYPYAGHLDNPTEANTDVLFSFPQEVYFSTGIYPQNSNLYTGYYDQLITSIGDRNSRLIEGYFYLTPTDISNLDFRKIIKLGNHFFQLQKVDKYNPIANGLSYVSLFKILAELQPEDFDYILLENDFFMLQENGVNKFYI
jgi:hypothetical protein